MVPPFLRVWGSLEPVVPSLWAAQRLREDFSNSNLKGPTTQSVSNAGACEVRMVLNDAGSHPSLGES